MTPHDHRVYVAGCYRCELNRDEVMRARERESVIYRGVPAIAATRYAVYFRDDDGQALIGYAQRHRSLWRAVDEKGQPLGRIARTRHEIGKWLLAQAADSSPALEDIDV